MNIQERDRKIVAMINHGSAIKEHKLSLEELLDKRNSIVSYAARNKGNEFALRLAHDQIVKIDRIFKRDILKECGF
jgi:hypothetical protein